MSFLTKEQIIAAQDRQFREVDVPEWGGKIRLASFDADQALHHSELLRKRSEGKEVPNPISAMLAASIVDEKGNRLFTEKDMAELGKKSPTVLSRLVDAVRELNAKEEVDVGNPQANPEGSPSASV